MLDVLEICDVELLGNELLLFTELLVATELLIATELLTELLSNAEVEDGVSVLLLPPSPPHPTRISDAVTTQKNGIFLSSIGWDIFNLVVISDEVNLTGKG